jgi:3-hydroxyacyl-CoA dehydrogenase/enoyl-CoA hydratase/3-hydroxybutyryl-CoA epimerase/enoyl-CoA isomerase
MYQGKSLKVVVNKEDQIAELIFDREGESINKFDARTVKELGEAGAALAAAKDLKGLLVTSAKDGFIVGADITEFGAVFQRTEEEIAAWTWEANKVFNAIEDLPFPSVTAVNGVALGGGFEMCLSTDFRVMATTAQIGFPEVKLGIIPGFGGTVRCPRLIGADNAIEWIAGGNPVKSDVALKMHAVDAVVAPDKVRAASLSLLEQAIDGKRDWKARRAQKTGPLKLSPMESMMVFETAKGFVASQAGKYYPAPLEAVKGIQKGASKSRDEAIKIEGQGFAKVAKTWQADAMVTLFLNDQIVKKKAKGYAKAGKPIKQAAVLGAGIMGGGIAYVSSARGTPIIMKDIADKQLDLGITEASKLLAKEVERKKMTPGKAGEIIGHIRPTLNYGDFGTVDVVVEAVVENAKIKKSVLAEVEAAVKPGTIIASNTSSISITQLAAVTSRPAQFVGMHFFNPVPMMALVEVIRGLQTSDETIATVRAFAERLGKTPVVVRNSPGFVVNRILCPMINEAIFALQEGLASADDIDSGMRLGCNHPIGPLALADMIGLDVMLAVMNVFYADFNDPKYRPAPLLREMVAAGYLGRKTKRGFYAYDK